MNKFVAFLKTTAAGGLFVILPILLIYLLLDEALDMITALAGPIASLILGESASEVHFPVLVAFTLLVITSFIVGLAMRSAAGVRLGQWIEGLILNRLPGYTAIKRLTRGFTNADERVAFKPALLVNSAGDRDIVYLIEDHGDGMATVLLPWAPTPFAGSVKIIDRNRLQMLDANLGDFSRVLSHWGVGVKDLMGGMGGARSM
jgi:uncharacterized membrane protein